VKDDKPSPYSGKKGFLMSEVKTETIIAGSDGNKVLNFGNLSERGSKKIFSFLDAFSPNKTISRTSLNIIIIFQVFVALLIWMNSPFKVLPTPLEVLQSFQILWTTQGLGQEVATSLILNIEALAIASLIALGLSYSTVLPFARPVVAALSKGRFLSLAGFTLIFTLIVGGGRPLKLSLLVFAVSVFYITSMAAVIAAIPKAEFDHARTLQMKEWRVVWEVVVLGTADKAFEVLRQNAAIGWMMLTMVEGIVRSEGGVGAMLLAESKHFQIPAVFAIQITIMLVGLLQDFAIGMMRKMFCPYADLTMERK
jgi:NitT/TauT family transport system permease protein